MSSSSTERAVPEVSTLFEFDPEDAFVPEPVQYELAFAPATTALEAEAPATVARFDDRHTAYRIAEIGQTLRWSWDHLNAFELDIAVRAGVSAVNGNDPTAANALFALLALGTGMRVTTLARHRLPPAMWPKSTSIRPASGSNQDALLKAAGWQVLPSPLPRTTTPASPGVLLRQSALSPIALGSALRVKAAQERSTDARLTVNAAMRKALASEPVVSLSQGGG